jgi:hypothetical protein
MITVSEIAPDVYRVSASHTAKLFYSLADLKPKTPATMHESCFYGDCSQALIDLNLVMKEILGDEDKQRIYQ